MKILRNERGIALAMIMILAAIALGIIAGLIYMLTSSTQISGIQKRYRTALEASLGGSDVIFELIQERGDPNIPNINFLLTASNDCLIEKLNTTTSATNWASCADYNKATSMSILTSDPDTYDFSFELGTSPVYKGFAKIVNTIEGNSGGDSGLVKEGVVASGSGEITVMSIPYFYTIEVTTENMANPSERANLSILYEY